MRLQLVILTMILFGIIVLNVFDAKTNESVEYNISGQNLSLTSYYFNDFQDKAFYQSNITELHQVQTLNRFC